VTHLRGCCIELFTAEVLCGATQKPWLFAKQPIFASPKQAFRLQPLCLLALQRKGVLINGLEKKNENLTYYEQISLFYVFLESLSHEFFASI